MPKSHYSFSVKENQYNPRFLVNTLARLTKNNRSVEAIRLALTLSYSMHIYTNKFKTKEEKKTRSHPSTSRTILYSILAVIR